MMLPLLERLSINLPFLRRWSMLLLLSKLYTVKCSTKLSGSRNSAPGYSGESRCTNAQVDQGSVKQ